MAPGLALLGGTISIGLGYGGNAVLLIVLPEGLEPTTAETQFSNGLVVFKKVRAVRVPSVPDQGIR